MSISDRPKTKQMNGKNKQVAMLKKLIYTGIILIVFTSCNGMLKESDGGLVISIDAKRIPYGGTALVMIESYKPVRAEGIHGHRNGSR